jgi:hypothetical protein
MNSTFNFDMTQRSSTQPLETQVSTLSAVGRPSDSEIGQLQAENEQTHVVIMQEGTPGGNGGKESLIDKVPSPPISSACGSGLQNASSFDRMLTNESGAAHTLVQQPSRKRHRENDIPLVGEEPMRKRCNFIPRRRRKGRRPTKGERKRAREWNRSFHNVFRELAASAQAVLYEDLASFVNHVTGRSAERERRRANGIVEIDGMDCGEEWESYRDRNGSDDMSIDSCSDDEMSLHDPMDQDDDFPLTDTSASDENPSVENMELHDPMDQDENDGMGSLTESFGHMDISESTYFEDVFAHCGLDENEQVVRRSPRLGGALGSFLSVSGDGRFMVRRSQRLR